jgi:hypothetical protein
VAVEVPVGEPLQGSHSIQLVRRGEPGLVEDEELLTFADGTEAEQPGVGQVPDEMVGPRAGGVDAPGPPRRGELGARARLARRQEFDGDALGAAEYAGGDPEPVLAPGGGRQFARGEELAQPREIAGSDEVEGAA